MSALLGGYARCSTDSQDMTAQRDAPATLGVLPERIYVDHGLTHRRAGPGDRSGPLRSRRTGGGGRYRRSRVRWQGNLGTKARDGRSIGTQNGPVQALWTTSQKPARTRAKYRVALTGFEPVASWLQSHPMGTVRNPDELKPQVKRLSEHPRTAPNDSERAMDARWKDQLQPWTRGRGWSLTRSVTPRPLVADHSAQVHKMRSSARRPSSLIVGLLSA